MANHPKHFKETVPRFMDVVRHSWPFMRHYKGRLALSFLALFASVSFRLLEPWPLAVVLDHVIVERTKAGDILPSLGGLQLSTIGLLNLAALFLIVVVGLRALCEYSSTVRFAVVGNRVLSEVRARLYDHLQ